METSFKMRVVIFSNGRVSRNVKGIGGEINK